METSKSSYSSMYGGIKLNKELKNYIKHIVEQTDMSDVEKRELESELQDHLLLLTEEYIVDGYSEEEAIKLATQAFGNEKALSKELNKVISPYKMPLKILSGVLFSFYVFVVWMILIGGPGRSSAGVYNPYNWKMNINIIPFKSIMWYATGIDHINLSTILYNLFGNIAIFAPLGFFLPVLFKKCTNVKNVLIYSLLASFIIEVIQFVAHRGQSDVDDIILNVVGAYIGYLSYKLLRTLSLKAVQLVSFKTTHK